MRVSWPQGATKILTKARSRFFLVGLVLPLSAAITEPIHVEQGLLSGMGGTAPGVRIFKGVPFAVRPPAPEGAKSVPAGLSAFANSQWFTPIRGICLRSKSNPGASNKSDSEFWHSEKAGALNSEYGVRSGT